MKQLPPYTIGCKTQIALIFKNIFKVASLSRYIILTVKILEWLNNQPSYLIKIFLKLHIIKEIVSSDWKNQNDIFPVKKTCYLKSYIPQLVGMTHSELDKLK